MTSSVEDLPRGTGSRASNGEKRPYHEAVVRHESRLQALANEDEGLFSDLVSSGKPLLASTIPTMSAVHAADGTNGLTAMSSFTGCGGSKTGFTIAGWRETLSIEFVKAARETLAANFESEMIEPEEALAAVEEWLAANPTPDLSHVVRYTKAKVNRGVSHVVSLDWESTLENGRRSEDEAVREAVLRLRRDVTTTLFRARHRPDAMTIWGDDIRAVDPYAVMAVLGMSPGDLDCFEGSPPCKSYSSSGLRDVGWGHRKPYSDERAQRTDDLFVEYVRFIEALRPKSFVAENVAGIGMGTSGTSVMTPLIEEFQRLGYRVEARVMNAKDYGVPQSRKRMIFLGVREDLVHSATGEPVVPTWPVESSHVYTCQEALDAAGPQVAEEVAEAWLGTRKDLLDVIGEMPSGMKWRRKRRAATSESIRETALADVEEVGAETEEEAAELVERAAEDLIEFSANAADESGLLGSVDVEEEVEEDEYRYEVGVIYDSLPMGGAPTRKAFQMVRSHPNLPTQTITATAAGNIAAAGVSHPHECRKFTVPELRALFTFPPDFVFTGNQEQQGERMGRAVPIALMTAIATELARNLSDAVIAPESTSTDEGDDRGE